MIKNVRLASLYICIFALLFVFVSSGVFAHGMSDAEKQSVIEGGYLSYLWLGGTHMLTGYDHLAFVFGIVFFLRSFFDIAKYITAFTLGHSVTLVWATYQSIQLDYYLIDAVIALSVCYIAFVNLNGFQTLLGVKAPNMLMMVTGIGLIHGFGLSTRLQELPLDTDNLLLNILTFNLGIELGQMSALAVMLLLLKFWRDREGFLTFSKVINISLIGFGSLLFLMQMHDYSHASAPQEQTPVVLQVDSDNDSEWMDTLLISIPAKGYKEYKVLQAKGERLQYKWQANVGELYYDFHGEPAGDKSGFFKSYAIGTAGNAEGSVMTPFAGTHGWYWKNDSNNPIEIELSFRGEYLLIQD